MLNIDRTLFTTDIDGFLQKTLFFGLDLTNPERKSKRTKPTLRTHGVKVEIMGKEKCFISVLGQDRKGIIAMMSSYLYEKNVNIDDLSQKVMQGYFVMTMLVDVSESNVSPGDLRKGLVSIGEEMQLKIQIQHENIFNSMHRI